LADTSGADSNDAKLLDQRLMPIAVAVKTGQVIERHWEFFKAAYLPGMSDEAAQAALLAWAERNGINASLLSSFDDLSRSLRVTHVRLTP
jgi:hypothetical protein